jgi:hypothetical protein
MAIGNFLKKVVPWIGAIATGNVPGLITLATKQIGEVVGAKVDPTLDSISQAIAGATPDQMLKLRELDTQFQLRAQELGFQNIQELEAIAEKDRESARAREIAIRDKIPAILAMGVTGGFFGLLFLLSYHQIPEASQQVMYTMVGVLGTAWISVVGYYFGSSAGSAKKSESLDKITNGKGSA